jgi:hypothetical protein
MAEGVAGKGSAVTGIFAWTSMRGIVLASNIAASTMILISRLNLRAILSYLSGQGLRKVMDQPPWTMNTEGMVLISAAWQS